MDFRSLALQLKQLAPIKLNNTIVLCVMRKLPEQVSDGCILATSVTVLCPGGRALVYKNHNTCGGSLMDAVYLRRSVLSALLLSFAALLVAGQLFGQAPTGTLRGLTIDPAGATVVGAQIKATDNGTHAQYATQS